MGGLTAVDRHAMLIALGLFLESSAPLPFLGQTLNRALGRGRSGRAVRSSRLGAMLAMVALLLQGLAPPGRPAAATGREDASYADYAAAFGDHWLLCLQQDGDARSGGPSRKAPGQEVPRCPVCQALHAIAGYVPPDSVPVPVSPSEAVPGLPAPAEFGQLHWATLDGSPRGPPIAA